MPFPANPIDLQVYSTNGNFFIFKTGKGWSRIEPEVFFKQDTEPTINDIKGRNAIWQDTSKSILYFWDSSTKKWVAPKQECGLYIPILPKFLRFYSSSKSNLINYTSPILDYDTNNETIQYIADSAALSDQQSSHDYIVSRYPLTKRFISSYILSDPVYMQPSNVAEGDFINARIPSDYNVAIKNPNNLPTEANVNQYISYYVQFFNAYNKPMTFLSTPKFTASWHISNTFNVLKSPKLVNVINVQKSSFNDSVYIVLVEIDTSLNNSILNYLPDNTFNIPTTFNIELKATDYNLSLVNVIPSAHYNYAGEYVKSLPLSQVKVIPNQINAVVYPQSHQIQKNGYEFDIPIIVEALRGYTNIYDASQNFTGFYESDGPRFTTNRNSADVGTFSIEVTGVYNVNGTPVATLTGTKTRSLSEKGLGIFDDLTLTVTGHTLDLTKTPFAKLTVTSSSGKFKSRDIFIYWT